MMLTKILVTGNRGFIGSALQTRLGCDGIDRETDVCNKDALFAAMRGVDVVVHLAAEAGVRRSIEDPLAYNANVVGFLNVLEGCRKYGCKLIYASSSSVYGNYEGVMSEHLPTDNPVSLYAATKKSNEVMASAYRTLYGIESVGLRFFTVYGPNGRKDMAPFIFTDNIAKGLPIQVFNGGEMTRDYTYIDDITAAIEEIVVQFCSGNVPPPIMNIGCGSPVHLMDFIVHIEKALGKGAVLTMKPMQPGDVRHTWANTDLLYKYTGFRPSTHITEGVDRLVQWYLSAFRGT